VGPRSRAPLSASFRGRQRGGIARAIGSWKSRRSRSEEFTFPVIVQVCGHPESGTTAVALTGVLRGRQGVADGVLPAIR